MTPICDLIRVHCAEPLKFYIEIFIEIFVEIFIEIFIEIFNAVFNAVILQDIKKFDIVMQSRAWSGHHCPCKTSFKNFIM